MEEVDKEISEMKLSMNARARVVAESYLQAVSCAVLSIAVSVANRGSVQFVNVAVQIHTGRIKKYPIVRWRVYGWNRR